MKRLIMLAAALAVASAASAQVYIEGAVGYSNHTSKLDGLYEGETFKYCSYSLHPSVGFYLSDRFDIGLGLSLYGNKQKSPLSNSSEGTTEAQSDNWQVAPFARYSFFQAGRFEVLARLAARFGKGNTKDTYVYDEYSITSKYESTLWSIDLSPILAYNLTRHVVLTGGLNFMSLGYSHSKIKDGATYNRFGFSADTGNVISVGGSTNFTFGFAYKF